MSENKNCCEPNLENGTAGGTSTLFDFYPSCPFIGKCIDKGIKCANCRHNSQRSHYEPDLIPYNPYPWYPYPWYSYPWYSTQPWITYC